MLTRLAFLVALTEAYTLIRYHHFKAVPLSRWPLFLNNKAVSLTAIVLLAWSIYSPARQPSDSHGPSETGSLRTRLGRSALALGLLHGVISLGILRPENYPGFYRGFGTLSPKGQVSLGLGILALVCLIGAALIFAKGNGSDPKNPPRPLARKLVRGGLVAAAGHVLVMGVEGWMKPATWPGGLPPISLLAFAATLAPLCMLRQGGIATTGSVEATGLPLIPDRT